MTDSPRRDPPEYNVYRSRRRRPARRGGDLDALRKRLSARQRGPPARAARARLGSRPGGCSSGSRSRSPAGWCSRSSCSSISAQSRTASSDDTEGGALGRRQPADRQHDPRARLRRAHRRLDRRDRRPARPAPTRSCSSTPGSAACASSRSRATPSPRSPATAPRRSTPPSRSAAPALMIETVEGFIGNGVEINHMIEVDFEDFPELIDALGGIDVTVDRKICSPPFDNFWKGLRFTQGRAAPRTASRRSGSRASARTTAPRRDRHRPRRAPAAGARRHQRQRDVAVRRSSGCPG